MKVEDYVVYFLLGLREISDTIIFVSDCDLELVQRKKLEGVVEHLLVGRHGEYDFGSYKRGFHFAEKNGLIKECNSIVFVNDSCYAPLFGFHEIFEKMTLASCDYWGFTENYLRHRRPRPHLQSFFLVFYDNVFRSDAFRLFFNSVSKQNSKRDVIENYEIGLSEALGRAGYKYGSVIPRDKTTSNLMMKKWQFLITHHRSPFLKKSLFLKRYRGWRLPLSLWLKFVIKRNTSFPLELLEKPPC